MDVGTKYDVYEINFSSLFDIDAYVVILLIKEGIK